jgi:hypothetical protein
MAMLDKLEKVCEDLGHKVIVHERGEDLWHVSVQGEHGTVAHARGKSQDDAATKVLELIQPKERKAVAKRRTKPAKIVATKVVEAETDGDE